MCVCMCDTETGELVLDLERRLGRRVHLAAGSWDAVLPHAARLLMRKHDLLRILSLARTLGAFEAASLLIQLRSQDRTLLCPPLCHV